MKAVCAFAILLAMTPVARAQPAMRAATSPAGPGIEVVLTWPSDASASRYNLYRRVAGQSSYPASPLNSTPITMLTDCSAIQAVIPVGSDDWNLLRDRLGDGPASPFDPCAIATIAQGSAKGAIVQFLARARWRIAAIAGQGYRDTTAVSGTAYEYELRGVNAVGTETGVLFTNVSLTAGAPVAIAAPVGLSAAAGDSRVLVSWGPQNDAAGFAIFRATAAPGPYQRVNDAGFLTQITHDLDGNPIPASNGFLDIQRWDPSGNPTTHLVQGVPIDGPVNGVTYFYRIASLDLLGQSGPMSANVVSATPADTTPPAAPSGVTVTAVNAENRLEARWNIVEYDVEGHRETEALVGYRLFRYESQNVDPAAGIQIGALILPPAAGQTFVVISDSDPGLRPPFGEKTFWYRVEVQDAAGNVSARSAAISGHLDDIAPPAPPKNVVAEGFDDFIQLRWTANTEPDLDGYQIYRSLCHNGVCNPCERAGGGGGGAGVRGAAGGGGGGERGRRGRGGGGAGAAGGGGRRGGGRARARERDRGGARAGAGRRRRAAAAEGGARGPRRGGTRAGAGQRRRGGRRPRRRAPRAGGRRARRCGGSAGGAG